MEASMAAIHYRILLYFAFPAHRQVLALAGSQQMELFPYRSTEAGAFVREAEDHVSPIRRENGKPYPETFGETVDEPLDFFVIENV
jgi:hypothetical protein